MKPGGILLAALSPKKSGPPASKSSEEDYEDEAAPDSEASGEDSYGNELAKMLGVPEEDYADFNSALAGFVRACMRKKA